MLAMPDLSRPTDGGVESMALAACLEALEDRERRLVLLAYNGGYSREELAGHFDAPVNTIKTWLRRALLALRGCLEQ
jgi:RNA polymerase sigma-70 factor (ECF subfamily)